MSTDIVTVQLTREHDKEQWGFQISGGKDQNSMLVISEVQINSRALSLDRNKVYECIIKSVHLHYHYLQIVPGSIAERLGIRVRDMIIKINNEPSADITNSDAVVLVNKGANNFALTLQRQAFTYFDITFKGKAENEFHVTNN